MTRGGARVGSGRKSKWKHPVVREYIPEEFRDRILEFAHRLDDGLIIEFSPDSNNSISDSGTKSELDPEQFNAELEQRINRVLMTIRPSDRRDASKLFKKLLSQS